MNASAARGIAVALGVALASALWFGACERRTARVDVGLQGEARRNPYLLFQRLLEAGGSEVHALSSLDALESLPPTTATLVIPIDRTYGVNADVSESLLEWAHSGGHLIVMTWSLWHDPDRIADPILDRIGIQQTMRTGDDLVEDAIAEIEFSDRDEPLKAEFDPSWSLTTQWVDADERAFVARDANGVHVLTLEIGSGWITTLTDDVLLATETIGAHDHAELAYRIVHLFGREGPVWIVWSSTFPPWWELAWRHGWMLVVSVLAWLGGWVAFRAARFGPLLPDPAPSRRELMEHVDAVGRLQLRFGARRVLVDATRRALVDRIRERNPGWATLDPRPLAERLAASSGLPTERVERALAVSRESGGVGSFTRQIATLERIRRSL